MPRKGQTRDVNLDCENIKSYREIMRLQMNYLQREFVVKNVSCCERGRALWRATLTEWMLHGFNPKNVPGMVKLWETQFFSNPEIRFTQWQPNGSNGNGEH